jgi:methylated-DNA-[protein]-cysteine S-methyltransferase
MSLVTATFASPIGLLALALDGDTLCALEFEERAPEIADRMTRRFGRAPVRDDVATRPMIERLERYFAGDLHAIDGIAVDGAGTPFQKRVWAALCTIPVGQTRAYVDIARAVGAPDAVRAVGAANGRNPIALVVPCHRVIGKDGSLTGYGGGMWRKKWLLEHEGVQPVQAALSL